MWTVCDPVPATPQIRRICFQINDQHRGGLCRFAAQLVWGQALVYGVVQCGRYIEQTAHRKFFEQNKTVCSYLFNSCRPLLLEEEEGFEPSDVSLHRLISSQVHSTTLPLFLNLYMCRIASLTEVAGVVIFLTLQIFASFLRSNLGKKLFNNSDLQALNLK